MTTLVLISCQQVSSALSYKQRRILAFWIYSKNTDHFYTSLLLLLSTILSGRLFHLLSLASVEQRHSLQRLSLPTSCACGSHSSFLSCPPNQPVHDYIVRNFSVTHIQKGEQVSYLLLTLVFLDIGLLNYKNLIPSIRFFVIGPKGGTYF